MYISFWLYLFADRYINKKRINKLMEIENQSPEIKKGDEIITVSGIYGRVLNINKNILIIELEDGAKMKISKNSVLDKVI